MPVTRNQKARLTDHFPITKFPKSPTRSPAKTKSSTSDCEKKENTPEKKPRLVAVEYQGRTPEAVVRAKRCLGLGQSLYKVVGREKELARLNEFIRDRLERKKSGSIYVSGLPGTGKTMCVKRTVDDLKGTSKFRICWINCMSLESINGLYARIGESLDVKRKGSSTTRTPSKTTAKDLETYFTSGSVMTLLCLDEIDQLYEKCGSTLSTVFQWPAVDGSTLVLVGIANSFDLTERCLKKLSFKGDAKPKLLHFPPYGIDEVVAIVKDRLSEHSEIMDPKAMELCARKCAAVAGDVRKALETCKLAVDRAAVKKTEGDSPCPTTTEAYCNSSEVLAALQDVYAPSKNNSEIIALPLQQKLLFASAMTLSVSGLKQFSAEKLYDEYKRICSTALVPAVDSSETRNLCDLLESNGLVRRLIQSKKYVLNVNEKNARAVINDDRLLSALLDRKL